MPLEIPKLKENPKGDVVALLLTCWFVVENRDFIMLVKVVTQMRSALPSSSVSLWSGTEMHPRVRDMPPSRELWLQ